MSSTPPQARDKKAKEAEKQSVNYRMRNGPGTSIPPYPLTGEAFARFSTAQQEAAQTRAHLIENHNMEVDGFGLVRFRQNPEPARIPAVPASNARIEEAEAQPGSVSPESGFTASEGGDPEHDAEALESRLKSAGPIISKDDPMFCDVALQLDSLRASGLSSIATPRPSKDFRPSHMALEKSGAVAPPARDDKYLGHKTKQERGRLPDSLNCKLWLSGLHSATTVEELFGVIHTGAVYSLNLTPAQKGYPTAAASLSFMTKTGTERFLEQVNSPNGIWLRGMRIKAGYNRHGEAQQSNLRRSRVLLIRGPAKVMTRELWMEAFNRAITYRLSHVVERAMPNGRVEMEFGFARVDGQAASAKLAIEAQAMFHGLYEVVFGADPCDPYAGHV